MTEVTLKIENMSCGACVRRVMQALHGVPGTHADEVRVGSARVHTEAGTDKLVQALSAAGFPAVVDSVNT